MGTYQADALQNITGAIPPYDGGSMPAGVDQGAFDTVLGGGGVPTGTVSQRWYHTFDASRVARTSSETRGPNAGVAAVIYV